MKALDKGYACFHTFPSVFTPLDVVLITWNFGDKALWRHVAEEASLKDKDGFTVKFICTAASNAITNVPAGDEEWHGGGFK